MPLLDFEAKFPELTASLKKAAKAGRLAHAYALYSDDREIRDSFSLALAQFASCPSTGKGEDACGSCDTCRRIMRESYEELYILMPNSKSRQIVIGKSSADPDTLRWFQDRFYVKSTGPAGIKTGIIRDADRMNQRAQNAFLKTMEDPPANTMFILTTGNPKALLPTIRSRSQWLVLLGNRCSYDFKGSGQLFHILNELQKPGSSLGRAKECAEKLTQIMSVFRNTAKENLASEWEALLESACELEAPARKLLEERHKAAIEAEYLRMRASFLSAIHTWFAQIFQLSCGLGREELGNPEIIASVSVPPEIPLEDMAYKRLLVTEELLNNLKWNVNEKLAMTEFCAKLDSIGSGC